MNKYARVMFGNTSGANGVEFKENKINVAKHWNSEEI